MTSLPQDDLPPQDSTDDDAPLSDPATDWGVASTRLSIVDLVGQGPEYEPLRWTWTC